MKTGIGRLGLVAVWAGWVAAGWTLAPAQSTVDFDARSIAFRTALHQDASLEAPFDQLVDLYRRADRLPELRRIYEAHLAQYPADQGARAVHLRLLLIEDDPEASAVAREAVRLHPADPLLHALLHQATGELEPLSQAIALETRPDRRRLWLQQLLTLATGESERALAAAQLREERDRRLATDPDGMPELIDWTERAGFVDLARESLAAAEQAQPSAEAVIDLTLTGARLDGLDSRTRAADRLTGLLGRLAPEHPRRRELVLLRREFGGAPPVADAGSPAGAVDLAAWLEADGKRREAGETLLEAALRFPHLAWLEERARGLIADEPDVWRGYLDRRATLLPARQGIDQERVAASGRKAYQFCAV